MKRIPRHQNEFTDDAFIGEFDLTLPALKNVATAFDSKDMGETRRLLVEHFRTRRKPVWINDLRDGRTGSYPLISEGTLSQDTLEVLRLADRLLENEVEIPGIGTLEFGRELDWVRPDTCDIGVPGNAFRAGRFFHTLAAAHAAARKREYAEKFAEFAQRWLIDWPFTADSEFHKDSFFFGTDRNYKTMPTGKRLISWMSCIYSGILFDPAVPTEIAFGFIKALWYTASWYLAFVRGRYIPGNHHVMRSGTVAGTMGIMFPETPRFGALTELARRTLTQHARKGFLADGGYEERSTSYTMATLEMFLTPLLLAKRNRISLMSAEDRRVLRGCVEMLASIASPLGFPFPAGDGGANNRDAFCALVVRMNEISPSRKMTSVMEALDLHRYLPKEMLSAPAEPVRLPLAVRYPASGYAVIRNAWAPDATAVAMNIPDGTNELPGHAHDDALSVSLVVRGISIIACPSEELYLTVNAKPYRGTPARGFPYSMEAHNVVLAGGRSLRSPAELGEAWGVISQAVSSKLCRFTIDGRTVTTLSASHTGYPDTRIEREILLSDESPCTITDTVTGPSGTTHLLRWHFDYGVEVAVSGNGCAARRDGVMVDVRLKGTSISSVRLYRDGEWMHPETIASNRMPPWVLDATFGGTGDDTVVTEFDFR